MQNYKIGFIGCGNIASAIISGAIRSGYIKSDNLGIFDTDSAKLDSFISSGIRAFGNSIELVQCCDFVFLTVKPQIYDLVLNEIKDISPNTCFISVAAGITIDYVKSILGYDAPVIRVMPNTPLMYGEGASALVKTSPVTDEQFLFIKGLFDCSGVTAEVSEEHINTVTAISGSAPAYVMRFAKDFISFAISKGMNESDATKLVVQAIKGSAQMILESSESIDTLIKNVTSPNGTTEAGLKSMDSHNFDSIVSGFLQATVNRAEELTK